MDIDEEMLNQFLDYLDSASVELKENCAILQNSTEITPEQVDNFYGVIHNLKGMGQTFGYDLLTDIGAEFCSYVKNLSRPELINITLVGDYNKVFQMIIEHRIDGNGGDKGQAILSRMKEKTAQAG